MLQLLLWLILAAVAFVIALHGGDGYLLAGTMLLAVALRSVWRTMRR